MTQKEFNYTEKAAKLEQIVAKLQDSDIQIDEATKLHAAGVTLVKELEEYLSQAEVVVKKHVAETGRG
ncbi:MAG TPA: exodeoxyribonuclease VII small subunit [Verrucomicrobiae bacterium]|nr:exodeoxyribonuclease VII small subunit [Verrucomicrobiae bacterium]